MEEDLTVMSLIHNMMDDFYIMNKTKTPDGEGGFTTTWAQSATTFRAALVNDTSMSARVAEKDGVTSTYTVTTDKDTVLNYHDVIKRAGDGSIYRITSNPNDKLSPSVATFSIAQVTAEKWELTT